MISGHKVITIFCITATNLVGHQSHLQLCKIILNCFSNQLELISNNWGIFRAQQIYLLQIKLPFNQIVLAKTTNKIYKIPLAVIKYFWPKAFPLCKPCLYGTLASILFKYGSKSKRNTSKLHTFIHENGVCINKKRQIYEQREERKNTNNQRISSLKYL